MALGFSPKAHRVRAKLIRRKIKHHAENLARDAKKHDCNSAFRHFANLAFESGRLTSETRGSHKASFGKDTGTKMLTVKQESAMLRLSAGGRVLNAGVANLRAACSLMKRRVAKKK